jgi:XTP/dITP diphosphohydrolase
MSKKILVVASNNNGKIKEIKEIFTDYDILSISEMEKKLGKKIIVTENQMTFSENAREKVNCLYQEIGDDYICIGDDSGISIDALDGFPGVHTARWMNADDHMKNLELLKRLENVPKNKRKCHYTTVIAIKGKEIDKIFEYTLDGIISLNVRGNNGFGFDEIFELPNGKTLAEITMKEKLELSPRRKALDMVIEYLKNYKN